MATSNPQVLPLIRTLSKGEKRYFKLQQGTHDMKFVWLFDYLDKHDRFDADDIVKTYPEIKLSQLPNLKTHLYKKLLESLSQFAHHGNGFISLRETVNHIQLLFEKGLYEHSWRMLRRSKKQARQMENFEMMLVLLKWERTLLVHGPEVSQRRVPEVIAEVEEFTRVINTINKLSNTSIQLHASVVKSGYARSPSEIDELKRQMQLQPDLAPQPTFQEESLMYEILAQFNHFCYDFEEARIYADKRVELFLSRDQMREQEMEEFVNALQMKMKNDVRLADPVSLERSLDIVEELLSTVAIESLQLKLTRHQFVFRLHHFFIQGHFTQGVEWFESHQEAFDALEASLDNHSKTVLYYQLGSLFFGVADYRSSLQWLNRIHNMPGQDVHEDLFCFARILSLICHYELNNLDVIDYYIRSIYRMILQKDDLYSYQRNVLLFLKKLNIDMSDEALEDAFITIYNALVPLESGMFERRAFFYFDIISWLESKKDNKPVEDVIRAKAQARVGVF